MFDRWISFDHWFVGPSLVVGGCAWRVLPWQQQVWVGGGRVWRASPWQQCPCGDGVVECYVSTLSGCEDCISFSS